MHGRRGAKQPSAKKERGQGQTKHAATASPFLLPFLSNNVFTLLPQPILLAFVRRQLLKQLANIIITTEYNNTMH